MSGKFCKTVIIVILVVIGLVGLVDSIGPSRGQRTWIIREERVCEDFITDSMTESEGENLWIEMIGRNWEGFCLHGLGRFVSSSVGLALIISAMNISIAGFLAQIWHFSRLKREVNKDG